MRRLRDGSIISNGVSTPVVYGSSKPYDEQYGIMRCRIVERFDKGTARNTTTGNQYPVTEYNCLVLDGPNQGQILYNVVDSCQMGGSSNYTEFIRTADSDFQPSEIANKDYRAGTGDFVVIANIQGQINTPIILNGYQHPQASSSSVDGVASRTVFNNVITTVGKDGGTKTTIVPIKSFIESVASAAVGPVVDKVKELKNEVDAIVTKYTAFLPDIDISEDLAMMEGLKGKADGLVTSLAGAPGQAMDEAKEMIGDMVNGLKSFKNSAASIANLKSVSGAVGQLASLVGFSKPVSFELSKDGVASMGNNLQKMKVDKMGQASIKGLAGMGQSFNLGGVMNTFAPLQNITALGAFNVDSLLTKIGKACKPASRLGDLVLVPTDTGPKLGQIISASPGAMV